MRGRAAMVALPALVVLALVALVGIAATGSTPGGTDATRPPSDTLYDAVFSLGLVGVVAGGILLVYGLAQRKAIQREIASGRYGRTSVVAYLAFFGIFAAFTYWRMSEWTVAQAEDGETGNAFPGTTPRPTLPEEAETSYDPGVSWLPILVVVGAAVLAAAAFVLAERRARRTRGGTDALAEELALVLDDTVDDLRAEADPRAAIIAAYARLERVLAANGIARHPAETSDEYLLRVLDDLALEPVAVGGLTRLFTRAKFSTHVVDEAMKEEAIEAFERVRDDLRRARSERAAPVVARAPAEVGP